MSGIAVVVVDVAAVQGSWTNTYTPAHSVSADN